MMNCFYLFGVALALVASVSCLPEGKNDSQGNSGPRGNLGPHGNSEPQVMNVTKDENSSNLHSMNLGLHVEKMEMDGEVFFSPSYVLKKKGDEYSLVVLSFHHGQVHPTKITLEKNGKVSKFLEENKDLLKEMNMFLNNVSMPKKRYHN